MKLFLNRTISMLTMSAILMSSSAILRVDSATTTVIYSKYDCVNGGAPTTYSLSISDTNVSRGIVGADGRVQAGFDGVVRLSSGSTGFIVDDHVIATAAHCVNKIHDLELKHEYEDTYYFRPELKIHLYNNDGTPKNTEPLDILEIHVPQSYINDYSRMDDYALLVVEEDLSDYTHFDLGIPCDVLSTEFRAIPLYATGRSKSFNGITNYQNLLYTGQGYAHYSSNSDAFRYTCDAIGGNSGCPVYVACQYTVETDTHVDTYITYTAIAIHCGSGPTISETNTNCRYNEGSPMTSSKLQFYLNNPNIDY
ncbi:MAG: trypsin-like peptidase domain-containing protein [Oscillospiraceae bacterium]|nr:trypsin-like peptidase domain-containing protein [Oscillospiraceae bacterium]